MTTSDLIRKAAETCAGGDLRAFARLIDTPERTVYRWVAGESPMPGAARLLVALLRDQPKLQRALKPSSAAPSPPASPQSHG